MIEFIFMLTKDDRTVENGVEVLESLAETGLRYVGFKDVGATPEQQLELTGCAHKLGMEVMLEVVSISREAEINSLLSARAACVDWVLGGTNPDVGAVILGDAGIRYCPFPGTVSGHPSVLSGSISDIAAQATELVGLEGVHGVDLLTYRHTDADPEKLTRAVVEAVAGTVIVAGSIITEDQIELVASAGAWGFTIGSALFDVSLAGGPSVAEQVERVLAMASVA